MMSVHQAAIAPAPKIRRMQPCGVRPGVAVKIQRAKLDATATQVIYEHCSHDWRAWGRCLACPRCNMKLDTLQTEPVVIREVCCTCANKRGYRPSPLPAVDIETLHVCERCGQATCTRCAGKDHRYCKSCRRELKAPARPRLVVVR